MESPLQHEEDAFQTNSQSPPSLQLLHHSLKKKWMAGGLLVFSYHKGESQAQMGPNSSVEPP